RNEAVVRRMHRTRKDGAEAARLLCTIGGIKHELVEALLVENDRAFVAEELQCDAPLPAPGAAIEREQARCTVLEAEEHRCDIGGFDRTGRAVWLRPCRVRLALLRDHLGDLTE